MVGGSPPPALRILPPAVCSDGICVCTVVLVPPAPGLSGATV